MLQTQLLLVLAVVWNISLLGECSSSSPTFSPSLKPTRDFDNCRQEDPFSVAIIFTEPSRSPSKIDSCNTIIGLIEYEDVDVDTLPEFTTRRPTQKPSNHPTLDISRYDNLDLHLVVDMSRSIKEFDGKCLKTSGFTCWRLAADFLKDLVLACRGALGMAQSRDANQGLVISLTLYTCISGQAYITPLIETTSDFPSVLTKLHVLQRQIDPRGNSCPSKALRHVIADIESAPGTRANKVVVLLNDGRVLNRDKLPTYRASNRIRNIPSAKLVYVGIGSKWAGDADNIIGTSSTNKASIVSTEEFDGLHRLVKNTANLALLGTGVTLSEEGGPDGDSDAVDQPSSAVAVVLAVTGVAVCAVAAAMFVQYKKKSQADQLDLDIQIVKTANPP